MQEEQNAAETYAAGTPVPITQQKWIPRILSFALILAFVIFRIALSRHYEIIDPDDAMEMLNAQTFARGQIPFIDIYAHRGPFLSILFGIPLLLFGAYNLTAVYAFSILVFLFSGIVLARAVAKANGEYTGILTLFCLLFFGTIWVPEDDTYALNSDLLMSTMATFGYSVLLKATARGNTGKPIVYPVVGLFLGLSFLTKQTAALLSLGPALYILLFDNEGLLRKLCSLSAGFVAPVILCFGFYYGIGEWDRFWHLFYVYNTGYAARNEVSGFSGYLNLLRFFVAQGYNIMIVPFTAMLIDVARRRPDTPRHNAGWLILIWSVSGALAAISPGRPWNNYLWALHAPFAAGCALGLQSMGKFLRPLEGPIRVRRAVAFTALLPLILVLMETTTIASGKWSRLITCLSAMPEPMYVGGVYDATHITRAELVNLIREKSGPDDSLYVNGYVPELYILSKRHPASRHIISNFVEAYYPGSSSPTSIQPKFLQELLVDLERSKPRIIVDAVSLGYLGPANSALHKPLHEYIAGHYNEVSVNGTPVIYVRRNHSP